MKLLLDVGNTRLKWKLVGAEAGCDEGSLMLNDVEELKRLVSPAMKLEKVLVSSVAGKELNEVISRLCEKSFNVCPKFAEVYSESLGVRIAYEDKRALGVDRWLALLAAAKRIQNIKNVSECVVIDAGSALTVDYLKREGVHVGGLIVPGISLMYKALFRDTNAVKVKSLTVPQTWSPGYDTVSCVENGVAAMLKGALLEVLHALASPQESLVLIAGGDAPLIDRLLGSLGDGEARVELAPDLVLEGLVLLDSNGLI